MPHVSSLREGRISPTARTTQGHRNIWAWAAFKGHDLVFGDPDVDVEVCVDVLYYCYHQGHCGCSESVPLLVRPC